MIFPFLMIGALVAAERGYARDAGETWWGVPVGTIAAIGGAAVILLLAGLAIRFPVRGLLHGSDPKRIRRGFISAHRVLVFSQVLLVVNHVIAVTALGWVADVRSLTGDVILLNELLALAPVVGALFAVWAIYFGVECRMRHITALRRFHTGEPIPVIPSSRTRFASSQLRLQLGILGPPLVVMMVAGDAIDTWLLPRLDDGLAWVGSATTMVVGLTILMVSPWLVRLVQNLIPLRDGPLHDELEALCRYHRVRVRDYLVWDTERAMINAAVMGFIAPLRYVMVTDLLLETLSGPQRRAVLAHEIGHVRLRHIPWLAICLLAIFTVSWLIAAAGVFGALELDLIAVEHWAIWLEGAAAAITVGLLFIGLGWTSRRFERQADTFAVCHLSEVGGSAAVDAAAVDSMCSALVSVGKLSGRRFNWRHGSIAWRVRYLRGLRGRSRKRLPINGVVRWIRVAALVGLLGGVAGGVALDRVLRDTLHASGVLESP